MNYNKLAQEASNYLTALFKQYQSSALKYHNLTHTKSVVKRTREIAAHYSLSKTELFILTMAAWFHDTGQLFSEDNQHEKKSVSIMKHYLKTKGVKKEIIKIIEGCILATKLSKQPKTILQKIICDADTYNLGNKYFITTDKLLKKEFELRNNTSPDNWDKQTLELLEKHKYFTSCCRVKLEKGKQKNIERVRFVVKK
ncbi:MAG: HD domain-containing protein [Chitinophagaceae bacterium]